MAWDFSTEPEFQKKLDWVREFVEREIRPLEFIYDDLTQEQLQRIEAPLKAEVKRQGLWAAHLDPELGGRVWDNSSSPSCTRSWGATAWHPRSSATKLRIPAMRSCWQWAPNGNL